MRARFVRLPVLFRSFVSTFCCKHDGRQQPGIPGFPKLGRTKKAPLRDMKMEYAKSGAGLDSDAEPRYLRYEE